MLSAILVVRFLPWLLFLCLCNVAQPGHRKKGYSKYDEKLINQLLLNSHDQIIPIHITADVWVPLAEKYNLDANIREKRSPKDLKKYFYKMLDSPYDKVPAHLLARIPSSSRQNEQGDQHEDRNIDQGQARNRKRCNLNSKSVIRKHAQDQFLINEVLNYNSPTGTSLYNFKMWSTIAEHYNQKTGEDPALFPNKRSPETLQKRFIRILNIQLEGQPIQKTLRDKLGITNTEEKKDKNLFTEAQTAFIIEELLQTTYTNPYNDKLWQEIKDKYDIKREADPEGFPERTQGSLRARFVFHIREEEGLAPPQLINKFPKAFAKLRAKMEGAGTSQCQDQQADLQDIGEEDNDEDGYSEDEFNEDEYHENDLKEDECYENDFYEEQLPQEGQQIHHEDQQIPYEYPPLPYGYPQLPSWYPQLPSGYPQLPSGYPQLPSGYQPLTHEGQQLPHEGHPSEDQLPDDPDTNLRLSQPADLTQTFSETDDLTLRLSQPGQ